MKKFYLLIFIISISIITCGEKSISNSNDTLSNLAQYLDSDETNPRILLGQAITKYLVDNPEWINSDMEKLISEKNYVNLSQLAFSSKPQIAELDDYIKKSCDDVNIVGQDLIWIGSIQYQIRVEQYYAKQSSSLNQLTSINSDFCVMLDPDLVNDIGKGILYYSDQKRLVNREVVLSTTQINVPIYFVTFADITPVDISLSKTTAVNGTYLFLTGIYIEASTETGNMEVDIFTQGNSSAFEYNKTTINQFDGNSHYDASGSLKLYPNVDNEDSWYYPVEQIALCRLSDDFEQSIVFVEDDHDGGEFYQNENTAITDSYYSLNCSGLTANGSSGTTALALTRYFRCYHTTDSDNYDDVNSVSEIRGLKISTVSTTATTFITDPSDNHAGVRYILKKVVIQN